MRYNCLAIMGKFTLNQDCAIVDHNQLDDPLPKTIYTPMLIKAV